MSARPMSTITFLFTDIEGSTRLWERLPDAMRVALARHDELLREAIEGHEGTVFKTGGDAFYAAFQSAPAALEAALAAQRALLSEPWGETGPLRVRMAVHTGTCEERDGDYYGPALSRVARLLSAGHGGQLLLSLAVKELVRDHLPPGASLVDLGERRLRDLIRPERVYQLTVPDLPSDFPPLRSLEAFSHNLPLQVTSFVGREREMAELHRQLAQHRLVTLTGVGGTGKTRLSLQVAVDLLERFHDGVWFIEMAPLADPALLPQLLASVLGIREKPGQPLTATLVEALQAKELLLLFDNCEHLIEASARLAEALLRGCPSLRLLASSREALGISGEMAWPVPSLSLPEPARGQEGGTLSLAALTQYEAVRLFIERAVAVQPTFAVTNSNAPAVAEICHRLDGIPLAIELAAARVRGMRAEEIAARLDDRFRLLTGGSRTAMPRQQTLRALIDWSHDLLSDSERLLLRRLAVFAGGWTLAAAEAICGGEEIDAYEVMDLLLQLVNKSLVVVEEPASEPALHGYAETRYRLLETIRHYAREKLVERGGLEEIEGLRDRHLDFFMRFAEELKPDLSGAARLPWLRRLEADHDNVRAALEWSVGPGRAEKGLRLAVAWHPFWAARNHDRESRDWLTRLLAQPEVMELGLLRAKALQQAASDNDHLGYLGQAQTLYEESLQISRALGEQSLVAASLNGLGWVHYQHGQFDQARALYEECARIHRSTGNQLALASVLLAWGRAILEEGGLEQAAALYSQALDIFRAEEKVLNHANVLNMLGEVRNAQGDHDAAQTCFEEALVTFRALEHPGGIANVLNNLGETARARGEFERAATSYREAVALAKKLEIQWFVSGFTSNLALALQNLGEHQEAGALFREGLRLTQELSTPQIMALNLTGLAWVAATSGAPTLAARLLGAVERLQQSVGFQFYSIDAQEHERALAATRAALSPEAFAESWAAGRALSLEEAVAEAMAVPG